MEPLQLAQEIAEEAHETKAKELKVLDLQNLVSYTDFFVLATGTSDRHVQAIAERVHQRLKKKFRRLPISYEGLEAGQWVLLDYGDVVLHVFLEDSRRFYGLDELWSDAPMIRFFEEKKKPLKVRKIPKAPPKKKTRSKTKLKSKGRRKTIKKKKKR